MREETVEQLELLFSNLEEKLREEEHIGNQFGSQGHFFAHHLSLELEKQGLLGSDKEKVTFELTEISEHRPSGSSWLPWLVWQTAGNYRRGAQLVGHEGRHEPGVQGVSRKPHNQPEGRCQHADSY